MKPAEVDVWCYHHPCQDGSMSAAIFAFWLDTIKPIKPIKPPPLAPVAASVPVTTEKKEGKEEKEEKSESEGSDEAIKTRPITSVGSSTIMQEVIMDSVAADSVAMHPGVMGAEEANTTPFCPVSHGLPLSEATIASFKGKNVLFCDVVPREADLVKILTVAKKVHVLDHHVSQLPVLRAHLGPEQYKYSEVESGCGLAWKFCFEGEASIPYIVRLVQEHDLGRYSEESKKLGYYINTLITANPDPRALLPLLGFTDQPITELDELTKLIEAKYLEAVEQLKGRMLETFHSSTLRVKEKKLVTIYAECADYTLLADAQAFFTKCYPDCDVFAFWRYDEKLDMTTFSLRRPQVADESGCESSGKHIDLSIVAAHFGGGGHAERAAVQVKGNVGSVGLVCIE